jgi:predicted O-methyltransferase YrrM
MQSQSKVLWYARNLLNFVIACVRIFFYCLRHPRKAGTLAFHFFSTINEFYQSSHGALENFETTRTFLDLQKKNSFAQSNYFNFDSQVARPVESQVLAALTKHFNPTRIFEIGTYSGFTTLHFAYNTSDDAKIYTLDLPPEGPAPKTDVNHAQYSYDDYLVVKLSRENIQKRIYRAHPLEKKIIDVFGDSMYFDFTPYHDKMDLIFIDGSHAHAYVKSDTENAFKMLAPGGVIIWHDYDYIIHRDVFKYLNSLSKQHKVYSIPNTRFAIYGKNL